MIINFRLAFTDVESLQKAIDAIDELRKDHIARSYCTEKGYCADMRVVNLLQNQLKDAIGVWNTRISQLDNGEITFLELGEQRAKEKVKP